MIDSVRPSNPNELDSIETAGRDEIVALQHARLRASAQHAYDNVAHYRSRFDEAGVAPADLQSLEDHAGFPFTVKEDLRRNYPFGMFAVPREHVMRVHASSGTTGKSTVVGYTRNDLDMWGRGSASPATSMSGSRSRSNARSARPGASSTCVRRTDEAVRLLAACGVRVGRARRLARNSVAWNVARGPARRCR